MSKWEWKKLGEVAKIYNGNSINANVKKERYSNVESGFPFIATKDVGNDSEVDYENGIRIPFEEAGFKVARKDTVLICAEGGSAGKKKCILNEDVCFGNKLFAIDYNREKLIGKFVFYYTFEQSFTDEFQKLLSGIIGGVSSAKFKEIQIPIPPLSKQKRIVKFLDEEFSKIDTLKTNAETNLKNVKDLFKVELLKEFSTTLWEKKKLGEVYNFIDYRGVTPNKLKEGIPLITAKNVRMGYIDYSVRDFISESDYKKRQSRGIAHKGDILFTTEAPLGFSAIADLDVFSTGQRVIVFQQFKNEKNICNPFFNWYFQSIEFQRMIKENATGLTATGIKASRLKEIKIPLPPLSVQKEIVARLDKLSENVKRLEANYKQIIANCDELKKSILKKTFEGDSRSSRE